MQKVELHTKVCSEQVSPAFGNTLLVVVRVFHRQFSVIVNAETIEDAENLVSIICEQVDFQIMNVVRIK